MLFRSGAYLLPKLRVHFAEFLNASYLERLRFLIPPTCVGLRYGHAETTYRDSLEVFPGSVGSVTLRSCDLVLASRS